MLSQGKLKEVRLDLFFGGAGRVSGVYFTVGYAGDRGS